MPAPVPVSMVVCDSVYKDMGSGKTALVGLFNEIGAAQFPTRHNRFCVFVSVTGVRQGSKFKLRIVNSETDHVVVELQGPPPPKAGPLDMCDMCFELNDLGFPEAGLYFVEFWGDDRIIFQRPIRLTERAKKKETES